MLTPLILLLGLTIATAIIAYWSDNLGKKLGKKRLSLFGLRPRTTATFLTIVSSWGIMLFTLAFLLVAVAPLRNALFEYDKERAANKRLRASTTQLRQETERLADLAEDARVRLDNAESRLEGAQEQLEDARVRANDAASRARKSQASANRAENARRLAQGREKAAQQGERQARNREKQARSAESRARGAAESARRVAATAQQDAVRFKNTALTARRNLQQVQGNLRSTQLELNATSTQLKAINSRLAQANNRLKLAEQRLNTANENLRIARERAQQASEQALRAGEQAFRAGEQVIKYSAEAEAARAEVAQAQTQIDTLNTQRNFLRAAIAELGKELDDAVRLAGGDVLLSVNQTLAERNIKRGLTATETETILRATLADARRVLPSVLKNDKATLSLLPLRVQSPDQQTTFELDENAIFDELSRFIALRNEDVVVRLLAVRNFSSRETNVSGHFVVIPVRQVFPAGYFLEETVIDGKNSDARIFNLLLKLVEDGREKATTAGISPPQSPETPTFFAPDTNERIFDALRRIQSINGPSRVRMLTAATASSVEPVAVRFEVEPVSKNGV